MIEETNQEKTEPVLAKPGTLRSAITMEIQTALAQRLVHGREHGEGVEPIIGVTAFGPRVQALWQSAASDDPYADWYLLKIEQSIHAAKNMIDQHSKRIGEILAAMEGFKIEVARSLEPIEVPLHFSNPYGYIGAYLVQDFDVLSRTVLTARHLGLVDRRRSQEILQAAGRAIRRTFNYAVQWRFTGVNREDIRQMNQNAERARKLMGEIPAEVLSAEKRARIAPPIASRTTQPPDGPEPTSDRETANQTEVPVTGETDSIPNLRTSAG